MRFEAVAISNLRCFEQFEFAPDAGINLICGANGSGKTSLLEGVSLASLGKSFLSHRSLDLVRSGAPGLSVRARVGSEAGERHAIVVRKVKGDTEISLDGQPVMAASVLAQTVPTVVINSKVGDILTENPSNRRALIDRTMFHVEPRYVGAWKQYRQVLRQRNELLRRQAPMSQVKFWDAQFIELCEQIDGQRHRVVDAINEQLARHPLSEQLNRLDFAYNPGWKRGERLEEQLFALRDRDQVAGHTHVGVHRADLSLRSEGRPIARRLSRGQGKFIVANVLLGLARFIHAQSRRAPVILVDDLAAELDDKMRGRLVDMINDGGGQRFFTAIKPGDLPEVAALTASVFHVEHNQAVASA